MVTTRFVLEAARKSGLPFVYWAAASEASQDLYNHRAQAIWAWLQPDQTGQASDFEGWDPWDKLFEWFVKQVGGLPFVLIIDNFHHLIEAEPPLTSSLQVAWDLNFQIFMAGYLEVK
jgi:hypothetical protein